MAGRAQFATVEAQGQLDRGVSFPRCAGQPCTRNAVRMGKMLAVRFLSPSPLRGGIRGEGQQALLSLWYPQPLTLESELRSSRSPQGGGELKYALGERIDDLFRFSESPCFSPQITGSMPPSCPARGALANVTNVGAGCGGRWPRRRARKRADVRRELAPAKPCGPDAPRAGVKFLSSKRCLGAMVSKSRSPGRARHKPSNHCAGKAGVFPPNLSARVRIPLLPHAHETAGAARTRSSLRPLPEEAQTK